jgi:TPP-dependent pyruvate/acetoin dehydrogenase alpha subunit
LVEVILKGTTNSITWPTNNLVWAAGQAPAHTTNENIFYFRAWREYIQGVYVDGSTQ